VVIGYAASAFGADNTVAIGAMSEANFAESVAIGPGVTTGADYDFVLGTYQHKVRIPGDLSVTGTRFSAQSLGVGNSVAATALGTLSRKMEVFNAAGTSIGFVPIYTTIT
jgi:Head domain of trimeric autotransporter adhesin